MDFESKKIWRYGDDVDTDVIIPARYLAIADWNELAEHARIFFRNAINIGLPVVEIGEQVDRIDAGDAIGVDLSKGIVYNLTKNEQYQGTELPQFIQDIAAAGGLVNFAKHRK